jgi:DNA-binding transcriptional LysR family regulator
MNIKNLDLNLLRVFHELYCIRNVSKASIELGISQSAVSNALQRLRVSLNDPLFVRSSRGVTLTPRAEELGPVIIEFMKKLESGLTSISFNPKDERVIFHLKSTDYFEQAILPTFLNIFFKEAPHSKVVSRSTLGGFPQTELMNGQVDLAIAGFFGKLPGGFYQQKLFQDQLIGVCRKDHPYLRMKNLTRYLTFDHIVISQEGILAGPIDTALKKIKKERTVTASVSNFASSGFIVEKSDLLVALPHLIASQLAGNLKLELFPLPFETSPLQVVQIWHERVHHDQRHKWFRNLLFSTCTKNRK